MPTNYAYMYMVYSVQIHVPIIIIMSMRYIPVFACMESPVIHYTVLV